MRATLLLALLGSGTPAGAASEVPHYAFSFRGSRDCHDDSAFVRSFESRTRGLVLTRGAEDSSIAIAIETRGEHTYAELSLRLDDGRVVQRSVEALSCSEALEAIGFVTALALDPESVSPVRITRPAPERPAPLDSAPPPAAAAAAPNSWFWGLGIAAQATWGPSPNPLFGGGGAFELGSASQGTWAPSLRLSVNYERSQEYQDIVGAARFERTVGSVDLCPWRIHVGPLDLTPCAQITAGAFLAEGTATYAPTRNLKAWGDAGVSLLFDVPLGQHLVWSTRGSAGLPWTRTVFQFDDRVIYEVPAVTGSLNTGVLVRFR